MLQFFQTLITCKYTFNSVGCSRTLNQSNFAGLAIKSRLLIGISFISDLSPSFYHQMTEISIDLMEINFPTSIGNILILKKALPLPLTKDIPDQPTTYWKAALHIQNFVPFFNILCHHFILFFNILYNCTRRARDIIVKNSAAFCCCAALYSLYMIYLLRCFSISFPLKTVL